MKILSIDSSGPILSLALVNGNKVNEISFPSSKENSEKLLFEIKGFMNESDVRFNDLNGITFGAGPGSFTGLRVACGIAYGIAYPHNIPIVGISSLEAIAAKFSRAHTISCIDARMNQIYVGAFKKAAKEFLLVDEIKVCDPDTLPNYDLHEPLIIGSAVTPFKKFLVKKYQSLNPDFDEMNYPLAAIIALLAKNRFAKRFDTTQALPIYIRNKVAQTIQERKANEPSK